MARCNRQPREDPGLHPPLVPSDLPVTPLSGPGGDDSEQARAAGQRAVLNTAYRSAGEAIGRLASLALFADAGRVLGQSGLGAFVFAVAFLGVVMVGVDLGLDRYVLQVVARERSVGHTVLYNVLGLKFALAVPLFAVALLGLHLVGYGTTVEQTCWALSAGILADSVARSQLALFLGHERSGPPALADMIQRILSAGLGIAALQLGYGVVAVAGAYSIGSMAGAVIGFVQIKLLLGLPRAAISSRAWRTLARRSLPFGTQDMLSYTLARTDTLLLSILASQAVVGRYGAAYRLFESTFFVTFSLAGAFSAMYVYLGPATDPSLQSVFQRSLKLSLVSLVPFGVTFAALGRPICRLIYGPQFAAAGVPLAILGPGVVLISIVVLSTSMLLSRNQARRTVLIAAAMAALNIVANLILIPVFGDAGAAAAMLLTTAAYAVLVLRAAAPVAGRPAWTQTAIGPLVAGGAMAGVIVILPTSPWPALLCGALAYLIVLYAIERLVSPPDVALVTDMLRRRVMLRRS